MTEEQFKLLVETGNKLRHYARELKDEDGFQTIMCAVIDDWCEYNHSDVCAMAFGICKTIQEAKGGIKK